MTQTIVAIIFWSIVLPIGWTVYQADKAEPFTQIWGRQ